MDASTFPEMGVDPLSSVSMATTDAEEGEGIREEGEEGKKGSRRKEEGGK